jgi:hypothetical protein
MYSPAKAGAFSLRGLTRENVRTHYDAPCEDRPLSDVPRCVVVGSRFVAARNTLEGGLVRSVAFVDATAGATFTRCVAGIDKADRNPGTPRLVDEETSELGERPIAKSCSLVASGRYPAANPLQFLKGEATTGAFSVRYERLRNHVVGMLLEPPLFAGQFTQTALRGPGATFLKSAAAAGKPLANPFDLSAAVGCTVTVGRQGDNAKVNSKPILGIELGCLRDVASRGEIPLAAHKAEIHLALLEGEQTTLMLTHDAWNGDASFHRQDAGCITAFGEAKNAVIVGLGGIFAENRGGIPADFECVSNFCDGANRHLRRQTESAAEIDVGQLVQVKLTELSSTETSLRQPRRCLVALGKRRRQCNRLRLGRNQLYGGYQLHILKYGNVLMMCQGRHTVYGPPSSSLLGAIESFGDNR